jgi:hypothetical protein
MQVVKKSLIWTEGMDALLKQLLADGLSIHQLEKRMGINRKAVEARMTALGLAECIGAPGQAPLEDEVDRMLALYDEGLAMDEIAKQMKRPRDTLEKRLTAAVARRRLRKELSGPAHPEPEGGGLIERGRRTLLAHGWDARRVAIMHTDEVMEEANRIRKAEGVPQEGRKPAWLQ